MSDVYQSVNTINLLTLTLTLAFNPPFLSDRVNIYIVELHILKRRLKKSFSMKLWMMKLILEENKTWVLVKTQKKRNY